MKKLVVIGIALLMAGCATVNDDGSLTTVGKILEWTKNLHSPVVDDDGTQNKTDAGTDS